MAYRMFTLDDAAEFIPLAKRDFFVQSMIKRWDNLKVTEKCNAILSVSGASLLPNGIHSKLSEVNTLRKLDRPRNLLPQHTPSGTLVRTACTL